MRATRPVRRGTPPPQPTAPRASAVKLPSPSGGLSAHTNRLQTPKRGHDLRPEDWRDSPSPFSPALDLRPPDTPRRPGRGHRLPHARGGTGAVRELRPADHRRLVQGRSRRQGLSAPLLRRRARATAERRAHLLGRAAGDQARAAAGARAGSTRRRQRQLRGGTTTPTETTPNSGDDDPPTDTTPGDTTTTPTTTPTDGSGRAGDTQALGDESSSASSVPLPLIVLGGLALLLLAAGGAGDSNRRMQARRIDGGPGDPPADL